MIINKDILLGCSCRKYNIAKLAKFSNSRAIKMALGLLDGGEDGEVNGVGLANISSIFLTQDANSL